jgi:hypothetical protein
MARRSSMLAKKIKAQKQVLDDWKENQYRVIVAVDFIKRCPRRTVPAEAITELANARCYPRLEPDGTWSALDTKWTREVLADLKNEQRTARKPRR